MKPRRSLAGYLGRSSQVVEREWSGGGQPATTPLQSGARVPARPRPRQSPEPLRQICSK